MNSLPCFDIGSYEKLIKALQDNNYSFGTIDAIRENADLPIVYIRHDADFFLEPHLEFARLEANLGCRSTYYLLLSGPPNLFTLENREIIREISALGHEIGLHYDLMTYPMDAESARKQLDFEIRILENLSGIKVKTISMHQPHVGGEDLFKSLADYTHPHDPNDTRELYYVSDSCRAWRDERLLRCFKEAPPSRAMILTHPEAWLDGNIKDRINYLKSVLTPAALKSQYVYFKENVANIWETHEGPKEHDLREKNKYSNT